ncbi:patatin-like phospholipase family protein [Polyangium sp. 15x6]|uniref:patatin-like phospholipase family protein n=1 Tax=Polyangium sp. 15x6 TaxID=3042687 RepID=UPI00249BFA8A|nr:patatin-like phospholipase family protein [Polyangium sp. 15x6]MDI3282153.1 patatin-like phospholipase family protein [Polyangium sp. 15x6]
MTEAFCKLIAAPPWVIRVVFDFSRHLLLLGALVVVLGMLFYDLGRAFGLPYLFRGQSRKAQFAIGLAMALLTSELFYVSYLVSPDELHRCRGHGIPLDVLNYLGALWGVVAMIVVASVVSRVLYKRNGVPWRDPKRILERLGTSVYTLLGTEIGIVLTLAFVFGGTNGALLSRVQSFGERIRPCIHGIGHCLSEDFRADAPREMLHEHVYAAAFFALLGVMYAVASCFRARKIPAAAGLCVLLALLGAIDGFFVYWLEKWHSVLLVGGAVLALYVLGRKRYRARFADLKDAYSAIEQEPCQRGCKAAGHTHLADYEATGANGSGLLPRSMVEFRWTDENGRKRPLVLVCTSGGGIRAAVWTAAVLRELERQLDQSERREFPYHVRMISGASGGMVGASYWVATLEGPAVTAGSSEYHKESTPGEAAPEAEGSDWLVANVAKECLSRVAAALVFSELPARIWAWTKPSSSRELYDRGTALENAFVENMPSLGTKLSLLGPGEVAGWRPSLVWSPMLVEDGKRLLISNLCLDALLVQHGPAIGEEGQHVVYARSGYELGRLFPVQSRDTLRLATAARMSASFPFVSPAAALPTVPRRRVVDAGYWDNYGVNLACGWLDELLRTDWIEQNVSGILLVQIRDGIERPEPAGDDFGDRIARALEGMTSPVSAVLSARESVMRFRNDEQVEAVARRFHLDKRFGGSFFQQVTFEFSGDAALSWYLTPEERKGLEDAAKTTVGAEASAIRAWWDERANAASQAS